MADRYFVVPAAPRPRTRALALVLILAQLASARTGGQEQDPPTVPPTLDLPRRAAQDDQDDEQRRRLATGWAFLLERDARTAFPARAEQAALTVLADPARMTAAERAGALMALGAARAAGARKTLEAWVSEGADEDRLGAILALGELGQRLGDADLLLVDLLQDDEAPVRECALLALLRSAQPGWRELASGLAGSPEHPLCGDAPALIAFVDQPRTALPPHRAVLRLLDLRWLAARRYGTVDGRAWEVAMLERLGRNDRFLDQVVLSAATEVHMPGVKDHLMQLLLQPGSVDRVRAAVRSLPRELDLLVGAGLWMPANDGEWSALVDEALRAGVAPLLPTVLEHAARQRAVAPAAAALLVHRDEQYEDVVLAALRGEDPRLRELACRGAGESGQDRFLRPLRVLANDPDLGVRGAAWAARLRLADRTARSGVLAVLTDTSGTHGPAERARLRDALADAGRSGDLTTFLTELATELEGLDRADLLAIAARRGRLIEGAELRGAFHLATLGSPCSIRLIEALSLLPSPEDLAFMADQFPFDDQPDLNAALARALIRGGHKKIEPVLRGAVWRGPFDRSVLAAAVVKQTSGLATLQHWVLKPPPEATSADIRRLGFAIGEWGGIEAIHELQERLGGVAGADRPALQGAFLGAMAARTH